MLQFKQILFNQTRSLRICFQFLVNVLISEIEISPVLNDTEEIVKLKKQEISSRLTISGILIAASLRTNRFEIKTAETTYTGDIAGEFFETAENITLNLKYIAEIQEVTERSKIADELTKPKYLLLSLQPIVS